MTPLPRPDGLSCGISPATTTLLHISDPSDSSHMQHRFPFPSLRLATTCHPCRTLFRLAAGLLGLALVACVDGSGADGSPVSEGAGRPGTSGVASSDIFIAPAGPLCAKRDGINNNCTQPTSSSTTEEELLEAALLHKSWPAPRTGDADARVNHDTRIAYIPDFLPNACAETPSNEPSPGPPTASGTGRSTTQD